MLPKAMRVTAPADFTAVLRTGRRAGTRHLALALLADTSSVDRSPAAAVPTRDASDLTGLSATARPLGGRSPRAGFVVSSAVGNSVVRHRVSRRLREQIRPLLGTLPAGTDVVVRAFPAAAAASSEQLGRDLRSALHRVRSR